MAMKRCSLNVRFACGAIAAAAPAIVGLFLALGYVAGTWTWAFAVLALTIAIAGAIGRWLADKFVAPLAAITHAHQQVTAGRVDHMVIAGRGHDEVAQLAHSFNAMAAA